MPQSVKDWSNTKHDSELVSLKFLLYSSRLRREGKHEHKASHSVTWLHHNNFKLCSPGSPRSSSRNPTSVANLNSPSSNSSSSRNRLRWRKPSSVTVRHLSNCRLCSEAKLLT